MSSGLRFRAFVADDLAVVCPWLEAAGLAVARPTQPDLWVHRLCTDPRIVCRAALDEADRLAGFYRLDLAPDRTAEITVLVAPGRRGHGIGKELLDAALTEARRLGLRGLVAAVRDVNHPALRFFQDAGFEEGGDAPAGFVRLFRSIHRGLHRPPLEIVP